MFSELGLGESSFCAGECLKKLSDLPPFIANHLIIKLIDNSGYTSRGRDANTPFSISRFSSALSLNRNFENGEGI
jgi:hypothetical protein